MNLLLWYIPSGLLALLLFLMLRNRAYKVCPWFFAYTAFGMGADVARFVVRNNPSAYFTTYWITDAGYSVLGILAMYEAFRAVLRTRIWWTCFIFPAIVITGIGLSLAHARAVPPQVSGPIRYILTGEIAVRSMQVLIFIVMGVHAAFFGSRWRLYPLAVAAGFGFYSTVELLNMIKFSNLGAGTRHAFWWSMSSVMAYSVGELIWVWFFRFPQPEESSLCPKRTPLAADTRNRRPPRPRRMRQPLFGRSQSS
jgi:hypothetical protein